MRAAAVGVALAIIAGTSVIARAPATPAEAPTLLSGVAGAVAIAVPGRLYAGVLLASCWRRSRSPLSWSSRHGVITGSRLPDARGRHVTAERSPACSAVELASMMAALTMASALALTG